MKAWCAVVLTLIVEALFAVVFARVLVAYLRRRDPLQRDVAVMFSALAVLFVLELLRQVLGEPPQVVSSLAVGVAAGAAVAAVAAGAAGRAGAGDGVPTRRWRGGRSARCCW